ncbi:MAG: hypothetical protein LBR75_00385 [Prevotellaceae bacterium]|nr:hypothetical protein [Prevotellaceae bacterium]
MLFLAVLLFLYNCSDNPKTHYFYYDTGELVAETTFLKIADNGDSIFYTKEYNKEGHVTMEGHHRNGVPFGLWHFYYSDGVLQWRGEMEEGRQILPNDILNQKGFQAGIDIEGKPAILKVGQRYKLRTYVEGVMPSAYEVMTDSEFLRLYTNKDDPERFPLVLAPEKAGIFNAILVLPDSNGVVIVGKRELQFPIVVE